MRSEDHISALGMMDPCVMWGWGESWYVGCCGFIILLECDLEVLGDGVKPPFFCYFFFFSLQKTPLACSI